MATLTSPEPSMLGLDPIDDVDQDRFLSDYVTAVRRAIGLVVSCTIAGLAIGVVLVALTPVVYHSSFSVLTPILPLYPSAGTGDRAARIDTIDTDARELTAVVEQVAGDSDVEIQVSAAPLTRILTIRVSGSDPEEVGRVSTVASSKFVETFAATDRKAAGELVDRLQSQIGEVSSDISQLQRTARGLPLDNSTRSTIDVAVRQLSAQRDDLMQTLSRVSTRQYTAAEITRAPTSPAPERPGKTVRLASSLMLGFLVGLMLAWRRWYTHGAIHRTTTAPRESRDSGD